MLMVFVVFVVFIWNLTCEKKKRYCHFFVSQIEQIESEFRLLSPEVRIIENEALSPTTALGSGGGAVQTNPNLHTSVDYECLRLTLTPT